ncbi:MAG: AAA family ATPase, partial [Sulfurimonas sp.]
MSQKLSLVEKELTSKITLWMLRIILQLSGHREFIDRHNDFNNEDLVYFLGLGRYAYMDADKYTRKEILEILQKKLQMLEAQKKFSTNKVLQKNITQITALMQLNQYEAQILEFVVLIKQYDILNTAASLLGNELNTSQVKKVLSVILQIPKSEVDKAFQSDSKLSRSSLVLIDKNNTHTLCYKLESISDTFLDNLMNLDEDITVMLKEALRPVGKSTLKLKDYKHIQNDLDILLPYLTRAVHTQKSGVNILLYGPPGTGKTELVKVLAKKLKTKLFEVSYIDDNDEPIDGQERLKAYKSAQALLTTKKTLLMYDE